MLGVGGDNLWQLAFFNPPFGFEPHIIGRGHALLVVLGAVIGLFDLIAFGVIFAGGVIVVQRLRGRM